MEFLRRNDNRGQTFQSDVQAFGNAVVELQHTRVMMNGTNRCSALRSNLVRLAVFLGLCASVPAAKIAGLPAYPSGDSPLVQKYAEYNRRWFDGKLPAKNVDIEWGDLTGTYYTNFEGEGFHARISIIRKVQGYDNRVCMEILHEMVHLKLAVTDKNLFGRDSAPVHDGAFQQEMLSLANRGAFADCW